MAYFTKLQFTVVLLAFIGLFTIEYFGFSVMIFNRITLVEAFCADSVVDMKNPPAENRREGFDTTPYWVDVFEDVSFTSREDHFRLTGWFIPVDDQTQTYDTPTVIVVPGHNDCKQSSPVLTAAGMLHRNGFNVFAIDLREHGSSQIDDARTAGGLDEYRDVLGAWDWLQQVKHIPPERIGLMGFSLGAATVIVAAGEEQQVAAVWEDSSFASVNQLVVSELARNHYPAIFGPATSIVSRITTGNDILSSGPIDALHDLNKRAYFVLHGSADARVDVEHAQQIAEAVRKNDGQVETWIVLGGEHTRAIFLLPAEYEAKLIAFFRTSLTQDERGSLDAS